MGLAEMLGIVISALLSLIGFFLIRLVNSIDAHGRKQDQFSTELSVYIAQTNQVLASLEESKKDHEHRIRAIENRIPKRKKPQPSTDDVPL